VPLILKEPETASMTTTYSQDPDLIVWWGTPIECMSALARRERENGLTSASIQEALERLAHLSSRWSMIQPGDAVKELAMRLLRVHPLRATDGLQLAAAILAAEHKPSSLGFVSLDARLALAAQRESFPLVSLA
jgi:predicted nucleic acid-binding protein